MAQASMVDDEERRGKDTSRPGRCAQNATVELPCHPFVALARAWADSPPTGYRT